MSAVFKKLNYKAQPIIHILDAPASFLPELKEINEPVDVKNALSENEISEFILCFCTQQKQVDTLALKAARAFQGDGLLWIAYPKGTSRKYTCDFNRDNGWDALGKLGFEPVRQVAIDDDWSALRFRKVEFIKKMIRSFAITDEGKKKTGKP
jgi:hypothetical protein